ncbi:M16 family metallopeptidase [Altericroceibacterium endophyticum]|nr:insulinase family protein [Altericroceibacterium endophyticum]
MLLSPAAVQAQQAAPTVSVAVEPSAPQPQYLKPDDPWIYRGTDIPVDKEWLFGEMPNGVRYAVRRNGVPPDQVSIRIRIDAGSLNETDDERGYAHLLEHLTFRQSKYMAEGQAIPIWQRLGATFGSDTNAETTPTQTVFKLDLPNARPAALDESMKLLSGMIREPTLSASNLAADLPIVLAEKRENSGAGTRIAEATRSTFFHGQRLADRAPIGTIKTLKTATPESVRAFHQKWYRPENTVIVAVGDVDPQQLAALTEEYFADWKVAGKAPAAPDFGKPEAPDDAKGPNPVGRTRVIVEPGQPRGISYAILRPWEQVTDNLEYNRGLLIDGIAQAIINRRLEARARSGGSYLMASAQQRDVSRSVDGTFVSITPLGDDWQAALHDVRAVIADAITTPPTQEEIDRELAAYNVAFANQVEQRALLAGGQLGDDLVQAVDIRESIAAPETILNVFKNMRDRFTPEAVLEHTQRLFQGTVVRGALVTPVAGEASEADLRKALNHKVEADGNSRISAESISFADLPPIGEPADPVERAPLGVLGSEKITYANGVKALIWRTNNEPGRVTVRVRFGHGLQGFSPEDAAYIELGQMALVGSGLGPLGQEELDRISTGRMLGFDFSIEDGHFTFEARTRSADVADQLYLFAAKLAMPRWDANPVERAKAASTLSYDSYNATASGILSRDLNWLLHNRDPRYATPTPAQIQATTAEGFREVWEPLLKQGPVEVMVFGDIDPDQTVAALSRTFGALPPPTALPGDTVTELDGFPAANDDPLILYHQGDKDQAAVAIAWPTGGGSDRLPESRKLEILADVFSNRLLNAVREKEGASYAPQVGSNWPLDMNSGGHLLALAQLSPANVPAFIQEADKIAADLATNGPTADELALVTGPMRQLINRIQTGHTFWMNELAGATIDPQRVRHLPSLLNDYTNVTPEEIRSLAAKYLVKDKAWHLAILPKDTAAANR